MTVAVPVERYSPFPWKHASQLPCPDHQPYRCYHGKSFVASDGGCASIDVATSTPSSSGSATYATSLKNDDCPVSALRGTPRVSTGAKPLLDQSNSQGDCETYKQTIMGGRSVLGEEEAEALDDCTSDSEKDELQASCLGTKKRKLCDMLDDSDDCGCRTPTEMTVVSKSLEIGPSELVVRCCHECKPVRDCCDCDPDDFFPNDSEIELPMCYENDDYKSRSLPPDSTSSDIMDNVIPDIMPSCRTSEATTFPEDEITADSVMACDRRRVLDMSLHKMRCIEDPEVSLRRSVLIANMVTKLRYEIRQEDYCRTVLPKKRRSYRRTWNGNPDRLPEPLCFYQGSQPRRRLCENVMWEVYPSNEVILSNGGKLELEEADDHCESQIRDETQEEDKNPVLGDIDSIFQSLMACVGGP